MEQQTLNRPPLVEFPDDEMIEIIKSFTSERLASFLDVTDLKADTRVGKIKEIVEIAKKINCASVCVNPVEVDILPFLLKGTQIKECYVIDFPLGKNDLEIKALMTSHTIKKSRQLRAEGKGKIEIDMVINVGRFKTDPDYTSEEIEVVVNSADGEIVKVIVRSSELTLKELYKVSEVVAKTNANFIKNSTGMEVYGATPEHIRIMREVVGENFGVKASGGISDAMSVMRLFFAGARKEKLQTPRLFRIGTSNPQNIISTMNDLLVSPEHLKKTKITPCTICPYSQIEKLPQEIKEQNIKICNDCKYKHTLAP